MSVQTGQHEPEERRYYRSLGIQLAHPTDDTRILVQAALAGLDPIYREGYAYSKCAVVLGSIVQTDEFTPDLFAPAGQGRPSELMQVVDRINARYGRVALHVARGTGARRSGVADAAGAAVAGVYDAVGELPVAM